MKLTIGVVQLNPRIRSVHSNIARARALCRNIKPNSLHLLCFPEMAFSGYVFKNKRDIAPYLEHPHTGPTSLFCAQVAKRLNCYVVAGYPERLAAHEIPPATDSPSTDPDNPTPTKNPIGANSLILYAPDGTPTFSYRKSNLFSTDMSWSTSGPGFTTISLPPPFHQTTFAICMDLNSFPPAVWYLADGPYELADHCVKTDTKLLVLLNNWLHSSSEIELDEDTQEEPAVDGDINEELHLEETEAEAEDTLEDDSEPDWHTVNYWAMRLRPLWAESDPPSEEKQDHVTTVVVCNRSGIENGVTFAGSSSLFQMHRGTGKPGLRAALGNTDEGLRIWEVDV